MEFDFDLDRLFPNRITTLTPSSLKHLVKREVDLTDKYKTVIDALGKSSAEAQALSTVITLFNKFLIADAACRLFVLRDGGGGAGGDDSEANGGGGGGGQEGEEEEGMSAGDDDDAIDQTVNPHSSSSAPSAKKGLVLGFLKVGPKDLFLHNEVEDLIKVRPTCVLDFYVSEKCQRQGCGKILFDYMLDSINAEGVGDAEWEVASANGPLKPRHLAYDRPSNKLLPFLKKHYELTDAIPQFNKFFIASGFFGSDNPCWDKNNNGGCHRKNADAGGGGGEKGRMSQSKSGSFYPYTNGRGGVDGGGGGGSGGGGGGRRGEASRSPMTRRWFSEDSVAGAGHDGGFSHSPLIGQSKSSLIGRDRSEGELPTEDRGAGRDILRGLENVAIGSAGDETGRFSRHLSAAHRKQPQPPPELSLPCPQQPPQRPPPSPKPPQRQPRSTSPSKHPAGSVAPPLTLPPSSTAHEAEPELRMSSTRSMTSTNDSRMSSARDWTMTPRVPIGSEISNPAGKSRHFNPLSPSAPTVSNAFIWMPSNSPAQHRVRAPYATTSAAPGFAAPATAATDSSVTAGPTPSTALNGNRRFKRTSLW